MRTGKLAVLGADPRKYDKALKRNLQLAILFQTTPQRVDAFADPPQGEILSDVYDLAQLSM